MANVKITALEHLSSTQAALGDVFVIDQVGPLITKKITLSNVTKFISNVLGNAKVVESNLISFASYANANAAALSLAISNISSSNLAIAADAGSDSVAVGSETLTFTGRNGVNTSIGSNEVTVSISNTGVASGTYGGVEGTTIKVPVISIDTQGRISLAQNTNVAIDFSSVNSNINLVQSNLTSNVTTLSTNINTVQSNLSSSIGSLATLTTTSNSNIVSAINELVSKSSYLETARFTLQGTTINNVSSLGAIIFSENKSNIHFAKLLINVEDLTYGQYQSSELLLVQDAADIKIVEYAIIHTSTNPVVTYEASLVGANIQLFATAVSSNNRINILKIIN